MRSRYPILAVLALFSAAACKRDDDKLTSGSGASVLFGDASPEAREALAIRVDYRLTDENFARWEAAQRNLDRLPTSAIPAAASGAGDVIDRAVARLESSPRARTAIESTGLTVRDFVVQTIALAQAAEAAENPRATGAALVPPGNLRFVTRYRQRVRPPPSRVAATPVSSDSQRAEQAIGVDTLIMGSSAADSNTLRSPRSEQSRGADSATAAPRGAQPIPTDTTADSSSVDGT